LPAAWPVPWAVAGPAPWAVTGLVPWRAAGPRVAAPLLARDRSRCRPARRHCPHLRPARRWHCRGRPVGRCRSRAAKAAGVSQGQPGSRRNAARRQPAKDRADPQCYRKYAGEHAQHGYWPGKTGPGRMLTPSGGQNLPRLLPEPVALRLVAPELIIFAIAHVTLALSGMRSSRRRGGARPPGRRGEVRLQPAGPPPRPASGPAQTAAIFSLVIDWIAAAALLHPVPQRGRFTGHSSLLLPRQNRSPGCTLDSARFLDGHGPVTAGPHQTFSETARITAKISHCT
jgi:hypothetical protein